MQIFDASSMIYAWDNYPLEQFPGLWEWMATQIEVGGLAIPSVAFEEVSHKVPECCEWLKNNNIIRLEVTNLVLHEAKRIKDLIGVVDDGYHPKGVDENDLLIIATARVQQYELISDEAKQRTLPEETKKYKIPVVCNLDNVTIDCFNFIEYIKRSHAVFR